LKRLKRKALPPKCYNERLRWGRAVAFVAGVAARIEAAVPRPLVAAGRIARSHADRADVDVAIEDPPGFFAGIRVAAAGERCHAQQL
jgi:hypothetical protein